MLFELHCFRQFMWKLAPKFSAMSFTIFFDVSYTLRLWFISHSLSKPSPFGMHQEHYCRTLFCDFFFAISYNTLLLPYQFIFLINGWKQKKARAQTHTLTISERERKKKRDCGKMKIPTHMWYDKLDWQASNCEKKRWKTTLLLYFGWDK